MTRLSRTILRDLILKELRSLVDEDALMPAPSLGEPNYLDLDKPPCSVCGEPHDADTDEPSDCNGLHNVDVPKYGQFKGDIDDLDPQPAFGIGAIIGGYALQSTHTPKVVPTITDSGVLRATPSFHIKLMWFQQVVSRDFSTSRTLASQRP